MSSTLPDFSTYTMPLATYYENSKIKQHALYIAIK